MIRLTLRLIGLFLLAAAFAVIAIDCSRSFAGGRLIVTQLGQTAAALAPAKMELLRSAAAPYLHPPLDRIVVLIGRLPTFLGLAVIGAAAFRLARKPRPGIGYSSR